MKLSLVVGFASAVLIASAAHAGPEKTAAGFWEQVGDDGDVGGWFLFTQKNGLYQGRLVKMFEKPGEPALTVCAKCPGDQKDAPMLGLVIVKGMRRDGVEYQGGSIIDPRDGMVYPAEMELSPDGQKLSVRGYVGIALLGRTQVWRRLPDNTMAAKDIPKESVSPDVAAH